MSISVNVDCEIALLMKPNINGDKKTCIIKNKTNKAFTEFLYHF